MRRGRDGMMPIAAAPLLCGACLRRDEHQAAHDLLFSAEYRRADPHQATVDLAVRDAHASRAQPLQVCPERVPVVSQSRFADFGLAPLGSWVLIVQGAIFVLCVLLLRDGIMGLVSRVWRAATRVKKES